MKSSKLFIFIFSVIGVVILGIFLLLNKTYTVTFDTKGGTIYRSVEVKKGEKVNKPDDPVMMGYTFLYWQKQGDNKKYDFNEGVYNNITLEAIWEKN